MLLEPAPLVTVIIPTYNRQKHLPAAVRSVIDQTYQNWQLLVVDDGSTDDSLRGLARFTDARLQVVRLAHTGRPARVRNVGVERAHGEYVAFLDSDDLWLPEKLEVQLRALRDAPECHWSYTLFDHVDDDGHFMPPIHGGRWLPCSGQILERLVSGAAVAMIQSVVAERALLREAGGFDEAPELREDLDLCFRLAAVSPVVAVGRPLLRIRHHPGRTTFQLPEVRVWKTRALLKLARATPDRRIRKLCRHQCAQELTDLAAAYHQAGRWWAGMRALAVAFRYRPWYPHWWVTLGRGLVRPVVPGPLLAAYQRARRRSLGPG